MLMLVLTMMTMSRSEIGHGVDDADVGTYDGDDEQVRQSHVTNVPGPLGPP